MREGAEYWHPVCCNMGMKARPQAITVAVTVWENRVSPVFDAAQTLLIAEINDNGIGNTHYRRFQPEYVYQLIEMLGEERVDAMVCGAVSQEPAELLEAAGIELISFISGDIGQVLERMVHAEPELHDLVMPGCRQGDGCRMRKRCIERAGRGIGNRRRNR